MFTFPEIGKLDSTAATKALVDPATRLNVSINQDAIDYIIHYTEGYPYFIQEYGKAIWNEARQSPITLEDAKNAEVEVERTLDRDFFSVRIDTLSDKEKKYLKALAGLGPGSFTQGQISLAVGYKRSSSTGSVVPRLIEKGIIFKTKRGTVTFTLPQFDKYVARAL